jgi:hypothetical protein
MLNRIKAALGRLWRPRRRQASERGFYDQRAVSRYRGQQDIDSAKGQSYGYRLDLTAPECGCGVARRRAVVPSRG